MAHFFLKSTLSIKRNGRKKKKTNLVNETRIAPARGESHRSRSKRFVFCVAIIRANSPGTIIGRMTFPSRSAKHPADNAFITKKSDRLYERINHSLVKFFRALLSGEMLLSGLYASRMNSPEARGEVRGWR